MFDLQHSQAIHCKRLSVNGMLPSTAHESTPKRVGKSLFHALQATLKVSIGMLSSTSMA